MRNSAPLACPVPPAADIVGERAPLVNQALARLPATVRAFDWVDIVYAAPIALDFDLRATRRCQMIEQVRQWAIHPIFADQIGPAECSVPGTFPARDQNGLKGLVSEGVIRYRPAAKTAIRAQRSRASCCARLSEIGYVEGQNVAIEYRWANNENDQLPELAADLVRRQVALIVAAGSTDSARAAKAATSTIPIVLVFGADPVRLGLVESLNRPGGNITGIGAMNFELGGKRLGLLHELLPRAGRFAILFDPNEGRDAFIKDVETSATTIGKQIEVLSASSSRDIDAAFAALIQKRADGLLVAPQTLFPTRRGQIVGNMPCPQSFLGARRSKSAG
jgi:hypothetical protein